MGDTQNMERSTLERKDRAELAAVAEALSIKVPSRAKKADIVSLILTAVGQPEAKAAPAEGQASLLDAEDVSTVGDTANAPAAEADADDADERPARSARAPRPARSARSAAGDVPRGGTPRGGAESTDVESVDPASTEPGSTEPGSTEPATAEAGGAPRGAAASTTDSAAPETSAETGDVSGDDGADHGDHGDQGDNGDNGDGEGATSRRRRRRRGRDRAEGGEQSQQPQAHQGHQGHQGDSEPEPVEVQGLLDLREDGYGFLRVSGFVAGREDVYVSVKQCRQLGLRKGDYVSGLARPATHKEKNPALVRVETVNGLDPEQARDRVRFDELVAIDATEQITVGGRNAEDLTGDLIDALAPLRQGQRNLIVAPVNVDVRPVISAIATAVEQGTPDAHLIVLLIDERPENVTSLRRSLDGGELVSATYDRPAEQQAAVAELALEHAKRLVEYGNDVVVLLDSLTGLTRAYNLSSAPGGRMIAGELDAAALAAAKRIFGAARNIEDGGSLTIVATALTETNSLVDAAILVELQRGANSTLVLEAATPAPAPQPLIVGASLADQKALLSQLSK
ncbi:MAG: transcription termination factor Rho [Actinobacteria bacterium]|nr:transcription termination factor Rho [Actinomycetota bacterium]